MQEHIHSSDPAFLLSPITAALLRHRRHVGTRCVQIPADPGYIKTKASILENLTETSESLGEVR